MVGGWERFGTERKTTQSGTAAIALPTMRAQWLLRTASVLALAFLLARLPGLSKIALLIESDYCYLLLAADRLYSGLGLTSLQPVAPMQPWEWRYDWGFLTQWPAGYSIFIASLRWLLDCSTLEACRVVSIFGCASALVGWFAVIRRCVPSGVTGILFAILASTSCLSVGMLLNPSTDLILIAVLPFIILLAVEALQSPPSQRDSSFQLFLAGLLSGLLCWFRYASIFVPLGIGAALCFEYVRSRIKPRSVLIFAASSLAPIMTLVMVNSVWGPAASASEKFNLGSKLGFDLNVHSLARVWWTFTDFGYYSHRPIVHWLFALWPLALPSVCFFKTSRSWVMNLAGRLDFKVLLFVAIAMLSMIVGATSLFGAKFDYIKLERYYFPGRPILLFILAAPFLLIPRRTVRIGSCCAFAALLWFTLVHQWIPAYDRAQARRAVTLSGAWSRIFEPGAASLYRWLCEQDPKGDLLVFSNFHEYVAVETGIVVLPIPQDTDALEKMRDRAGSIRGIENPRAVFVLNPQNLWRDYWIKSPNQIIEEFGLEPLAAAPPELHDYLFVRGSQAGPKRSRHNNVVETNFAGFGVDDGDSLGIGSE